MTSTNFICQWKNEKSCHIKFIDRWINNHISIRFVNEWTCVVIIPYCHLVVIYKLGAL
jgi:hypothetical protein